MHLFIKFIIYNPLNRTESFVFNSVIYYKQTSKITSFKNETEHCLGGSEIQNSFNQCGTFMRRNIIFTICKD